MAYHNYVESQEVKQAMGLGLEASASACVSLFGGGCEDDSEAQQAAPPSPNKGVAPPPPPKNAPPPPPSGIDPTKVGSLAEQQQRALLEAQSIWQKATQKFVGGTYSPTAKLPIGLQLSQPAAPKAPITFKVPTGTQKVFGANLIGTTFGQGAQAAVEENKTLYYVGGAALLAAVGFLAYKYAKKG